MTSTSDQNGESRKTLDDIRREIDAEYAFAEPESLASEDRLTADVDAAGDESQETVRQAAGERRRSDTLRRPRLLDRPAEARMSDAWGERESTDEERLEQIFERHQVAMGRRRADDQRPGRTGYLLAALIGGVAGQALLLVFFLVAQRGLAGELLRTKLAVSPRAEAPASTSPAPSVLPASASAPAAPAAPAPSATPAPSAASTPTDDKTEPIANVSPDAAPAPEMPPQRSSAAAPSGPTEPPADLPARTPKPSASGAPPATVSAATVPSPSRSRPSEASPAPAGSTARRPPRDQSGPAEAKARLRTAVDEWLKTAASGGGAVHATEPVIVLNPDGRTAKTYLSVSSPIGLIPREQRWELGPRGWDLLDDRQAGLPIPSAAPRGR